MALSLDSKVRDIMRSPEGKLVMEKYAPGSTKDPTGIRRYWLLMLLAYIAKSS